MAVNPLPHNPPITTLKKKPNENIEGKGENADTSIFWKKNPVFVRFVRWKVLNLLKTSNCTKQTLPDKEQNWQIRNENKMFFLSVTHQVAWCDQYI